MADDTLQIYVASLSDYVNGTLHGRWVDANQDPDCIREEIQEMLNESPTAREYGDVAEEYAIHDYNGFTGFSLGEHESLEKISAIAKALEEFPAYVVAHYFTQYSHKELDEMEDLIREGLVETIEECWGDETEALAHHLFDDIEQDSELPEKYKMYAMDIARSMAHDHLCNGDYNVLYEGGGTYHILDNHVD